MRLIPSLFLSACGRYRFPAQEGHLSVPLFHDEPDGPALDLRVARIASRAPRTAAPIIYLAGGPGQSAFEDVAQNPALLQSLLGVADVILFDQRGAGRSRPVLSLPTPSSLSMADGFDRAAFIADCKSRAVAARNFWSDVGLGLDAFHTEASVADIAEILDTFDLETASLFGTSYGSHLGLATLRALPDRMDRAVLGLVEGLDDTYKLPQNVQRFLDKASRGFARAGEGQLVDMMDDVHEGLARKPARIATDRGTVTITDFMVKLAASEALGNLGALRLLPAAYRRATTGDYRGFETLIAAVEDEIHSINAMFLAMDAASSATQDRKELIAEQTNYCLLDDVYNLPILQIEEDIGAQDLGDEFRSGFDCAVPTLFLSGDMDGRTPQSNALAAAKGFSIAHQMLVQGCAHALTEDSGYLPFVASFLSGVDPTDEVTGTPFDYRTRA